MVSNTLEMDLQDLIDTLELLRRKFGKSPEYQKLRREFPDDWPI